MPPVSDPAEDSDVASFDVLSVGDDLRATVFRHVAHLFPQLLHFLIFCFPLLLGTPLRPFRFTKTQLAVIAESVQRLLECG